MNGGLAWAGSAAGALLAIGTVVRYLFRRAVRAAVWTAAAVRLPETVDNLSATVTTLTTSVDLLTNSITDLQELTRSQHHGHVSLSR